MLDFYRKTKKQKTHEESIMSKRFQIAMILLMIA